MACLTVIVLDCYLDSIQERLGHMQYQHLPLIPRAGCDTSQESEKTTQACPHLCAAISEPTRRYGRGFQASASGIWPEHGLERAGSPNPFGGLRQVRRAQTIASFPSCSSAPLGTWYIQVLLYKHVSMRPRDAAGLRANEVSLGTPVHLHRPIHVLTQSHSTSCHRYSPGTDPYGETSRNPCHRRP